MGVCMRAVGNLVPVVPALAVVLVLVAAVVRGGFGRLCSGVSAARSS